MKNAITTVFVCLIMLCGINGTFANTQTGHPDGCVHIGDDVVIIIIFGNADGEFRAGSVVIDPSWVFLWNPNAAVSPENFARPSEIELSDSNGDGYMDANLHFWKDDLIEAGMYTEPANFRLHFRDIINGIQVLFPKVIFCEDVTPIATATAIATATPETTATPTVEEVTPTATPEATATPTVEEATPTETPEPTATNTPEPTTTPIVATPTIEPATPSLPPVPEDTLLLFGPTDPLTTGDLARIHILVNIGDEDLSSYNVKITYDSSDLELVEPVESGDDTGEFTGPVVTPISPGIVRISGSIIPGATAPSGELELAEVIFRVLDTDAETSTLTPSDSILLDSDVNLIEVTEIGHTLDLTGPEPTATPILEFTATPTVEETTATVTPEPTATNTPEPTETNTPEPTATDTPEATATPTIEEATPTVTPEATATNTPEPEATATPTIEEATPTVTPEATATNTPEPEATATPTIEEATPTVTPEATATNTPEPEPTATPTLAPDENLVSLLPDGGPFDVGDTITTRLTIDVGTSNLGSYAVTINYDPAVLQFLDPITAGAGTGTNFLGPNRTIPEAGQVRVFGTHVEGTPPTGEVEVAIVQFSALGTTATGTTILSLSDPDIRDASANVIPVNLVTTIITLNSVATATPIPEATATETPEPVATDTPEATATNTPEPEATATPTIEEATPTVTPEATATNTPEPEATATPTIEEATPTVTPEATVTNTPEPEATATPTIEEATPTVTPEATVTNTPEPTSIPATPTITPATPTLPSIPEGTLLLFGPTDPLGTGEQARIHILLNIGDDQLHKYNVKITFDPSELELILPAQPGNDTSGFSGPNTTIFGPGIIRVSGSLQSGQTAPSSELELAEVLFRVLDTDADSTTLTPSESVLINQDGDLIDVSQIGHILDLTGDSVTPTPEATATLTPEATVTPEATATNTPEVVATPTVGEATPTVTPEITATPTIDEATPTVTPEVTATPTVTPEPTATVTPIIEPTASPTEVPSATPVVHADIRPGFCPNPVQVNRRGLLPVALLGTSGLDISKIDPDSIRLEGVAPHNWHYADVSSPFEGELDSCSDCNTSGKDGNTDLVLRFDNVLVVATLLSKYPEDVLGPINCLHVHITGRFRPEFGGGTFHAHDTARLQFDRFAFQNWLRHGKEAFRPN